MQGLLDWIKTPEGQGLLGMAAGYAANAQRGAPVNSLGRGGLTGLLAYGNAQNRQEESAERAKMGQYRDAQITAFNTKAAADAEALARERAKREALPGLFKAPTMTGGEAMPQELGGVPMFSKPMGVSPMQQQPGGFDVLGAIRAGYSVDEATKLAGVPDIGKQEVARTQEVDDGNGGKRVIQLDKFGRPVGEGMAGYVAPVQVNQGGQITFARPQAGAAFPVSMSPSERDASARGWAGNRMTAERLAFDKAGGADANKPPPGYRWNANRSGMEIIPGGPADQKASAEGQKKVSEARDVLGLLDEVDSLLPQATGSYAGVGADEAARVFGFSTTGSEATAQLKTLQGALISKMPKMSGPQSDKDVQLYREMAGQVADPTLPVSARQKASQTIRTLNEKYAGMEPGSSAKPTVVKTGMYGGRKVEQLSDGTTRYAD